MEEAAYENFYVGSHTPFEPEFGEYFTGHRMAHADIGAPTSPMTADQIRQASRLLNTGMKIVEVGAIQQDVFEAIPKQHFKEMKRLAEVTGTKMTMHGPIIDLAGFSQQGWDNRLRKMAEAQVVDALEKAHELDPEGNIPVTFHAGPPLPLQKWVHVPKKEADEMIQNIQGRAEEAKRKLHESERDRISDLKNERMQESILAVNPDTGQIREVRYERQIWPEGIIEFDPKSRIDSLNLTEWENERFGIARLEEEKARLARMIPAEEYGMLKESIKNIPEQKIREIERKGRFGHALLPDEKEAAEKITRLQQIEWPLKETNFHQYMSLRNMYNDFMKHGQKDYTKHLQESVKEIVGPEMDNIKNNVYSDKLIQELNNKIMQLPPPEKWKPADEFGTEKVAETTAAAALKVWKKFGSKAPVIALENYPETVMSTGEDSVKVINAARKRFVEKAKEQGMAEAAARNAAEKLIGVTWDYGHINMLRRHGFPEKFVTEETKKVAEYIKKVHLTDNFGFADSHLPPGMGNIPYKEALAVLEQKGIKAPQIVEASGFVQHFKTNPHPYVLEALGSPLYTMMSQPYWNQIRGTYGSYFQGYGEFLPDFHFRTYGSPSFSALPSELGGEMPGERRQTFTGQPAE